MCGGRLSAAAMPSTSSEGEQGLRAGETGMLRTWQRTLHPSAGLDLERVLRRGREGGRRAMTNCGKARRRAGTAGCRAVVRTHCWPHSLEKVLRLRARKSGHVSEFRPF